MDVQSRSEDAAALGALIQALARYAAEVRNGDPLPPPEAIALSAWRASRDGLQATIAHGGSLRPVPEVVRDVLARARPHARELGTEEELEGVERILREGNGADRQRAAAGRGDLEALLQALRDETAK
jgi:carboxylate-amine ligase